jgi:hypothetical protein
LYMSEAMLATAGHSIWLIQEYTPSLVLFHRYPIMVIDTKTAQQV